MYRGCWRRVPVRKTSDAGWQHGTGCGGGTRSAPSLEALLKAGAIPDAPSRAGLTPLMQAAQANQPETVRLLLRAGAQGQPARQTGRYGLDACGPRDASADVVRALLEAGADTGLRNDNRSNAVDIATSLRREQISRLLADRD